MRKFLSVIALLLVAIMLFTACDFEEDVSDGEETEETEKESKKETNKKKTDKKETEESEKTEETEATEETKKTEKTEESEETEAMEETEATEETEETEETEATKKETKDTEKEEPEMQTKEPILKDSYKESVKILAIGNSFSDDAMEHLAIILKDAGVKEIVLGNLYIGGCSLDTHYGNIVSQAANYEFRVNTGDGWSTTKQNIDTGIKYADWDVITLQQASHDSGKPETYSKLADIIEHVKNTASNKDVKIAWHMTWAYQANSTHGGFANYGKNQMTMYNAITSSVKSKVLTADYIETVIPSGTAIQNLRTSYLGDTLTRDGFHLSYGIGRYTAGLMYFKQLTGADISKIDAVPAKYSEIYEHLPAIKEAVNAAYESNFAPTKVTSPEPENELLVMTDADKTHLRGLGLDPEIYEVLDLKLKVGAYYLSTDNSNFATPRMTAGNSPQYIATAIFTPTSLPVGSVVNIADGYKYRLEGWQKLNVKNAQPRLDSSSENFIVAASHYANYNFLAFNISNLANTDISYSDRAALRIYVPIRQESTVLTSEDRAYLTGIGKNPDNYERLALDYSIFAYYNCNSNVGSAENGHTDENLVNFLATKVFGKSDIPNGSVIRIDKGYQYRPEGWQGLGVALSGERPDNVIGTNEVNYVITDDAWWKDYNYRGFNVAVQGAGAVVSEETGTHFVIYAYKG